jgi:hypothetical protein
VTAWPKTLKKEYLNWAVKIENSELLTSKSIMFHVEHFHSAFGIHNSEFGIVPRGTLFEFRTPSTVF